MGCYFDPSCQLEKTFWEDWFPSVFSRSKAYNSVSQTACVQQKHYISIASVHSDWNIVIWHQRTLCVLWLLIKRPGGCFWTLQSLKPWNLTSANTLCCVDACPKSTWHFVGLITANLATPSPLFGYSDWYSSTIVNALHNSPLLLLLHTARWYFACATLFLQVHQFIQYMQCPLACHSGTSGPDLATSHSLPLLWVILTWGGKLNRFYCSLADITEEYLVGDVSLIILAMEGMAS